MIRELCDICEKNDVNVRYKIKKSRKGTWEDMGVSWFFDKDRWQPYQEIVICDECAEKLFGVMKKDK